MAEFAELTHSQEMENENVCVVCFKHSLIFSIGVCSHPVCFECSSRMRCLCLQNECPICRQDLPKVIFTKKIAPYATLDREVRSGLYEKKFRIVFADLEIQKVFYRLLENRCPQCEHHPFAEFGKLKEHVRKVHELHYCEICTENIKIFSSERRCYSRSQMAVHRKTGDPDDTSHKGHPHCEYCELRYLDKDELFRHLRREHFFCHLCDADGINVFYGSYPEMRNHFKSEHFLCEEAECADEQFTAVFRSEIDLKAHKATVHSKSMSKTAVKQARTLEIEFSYGPRGRGGGPENSRGGGRNRQNQNDPQREFDRERIPEQTIIQQEPIKIDSKNEKQFPSLGVSSAPAAHVQLSNSVRHVVYGSSGLARTKENFPALGGLGQPAPSSSHQQQASSNRQSKMPSASSMLKGSGGKQSSAKSSNRQSNFTSSAPKNDSITDFPALTSSGLGPLPSKPYIPMNRQMSSTSAASSTTSASKKNSNADYPALTQSVSKKNRNKALLMEDMIVPESNVNVNLVSSKHRNLVDDYVSMASQISKVQIVQQKDAGISAEDKMKKVPKLNSANNFPSLGPSSETAASPAQWITAKPVNIQKPQVKHEIKETPKKSKKSYEMPAKLEPKVFNGTSIKKANDKDRKEPNNSNNKENKNENLLEQKSFPKLGAQAEDLSPPPGFSSSDPLPKKPPPGFKNFSLNSVSNDDYNINQSSADYSFFPPPNASKRNQALVGEFQKAVTSAESMQEFRQMSQMFRDGNYFAKSYYDTCKVVLGGRFNEIFPELLALLPDIEKQQSLYIVHMEDYKNSDGFGGAKSKKKSSKSGYDLEVCATCKQVLRSVDLVNHVQSHALENNFPSLSVTADSVSVKGWKK